MSVNALGIVTIAMSLSLSAYAASPFLNSKDAELVGRFECDAIHQVVVAMFSKLQSDNDNVGYAQHLAESDSIHTPIEQTATDRGVRQQHRKLNLLWLLLFFGLLIVLSLLFGLHRTARRGVSYSKAGAHWTIDWRDVLFFWLDLILSGGKSGGDDAGSSSSSGRFSGGGGSFGGGGAGSSW